MRRRRMKTMKKMKRIVALFLAVFMMMSMSVTAFAENETKPGYIKINGALATNSYTIYRIFDLESFIRLPSKAIKSDGFVLSSLEASLWCFMTTVDLSVPSS